MRVGPALDSLRGLVDGGEGPFDLSSSTPTSRAPPSTSSRRSSSRGRVALIVVDNVVRDGALIDPDSSDPGARGMRRFLELAAVEPRVTATTIQTVGSKGYDGFTLALVQDV